jgi:hypothetical protein
MRLNIAIPEEHVAKPILDAALESVTRLNQDMLKSGTVPTFTDALPAVRWRPEPPGGECFDHAARVLGRGWGDCDDLAPWHAASLRETGVDPGAHAVVRRSGPKRWHAVVRRSDGNIEDPSYAAGMRVPAGARAPTLPTMSSLSGIDGDVEVAQPQLALRPLYDRDSEVVGYDARVDIPWHHADSDFRKDVASVVLRRAPVADQAVCGALRGGAWVAEASGLVHPAVVGRLLAMSDLVEGADYEHLVRTYGPEEAEQVISVIGSFWDTFTDIASKVVSFVPGIGPIASAAIDAAHGGVKAIQAAEAENAARAAAAKAPKIPPKVIAQAKAYHKHLKRGGAPAEKRRARKGPGGTIQVADKPIRPAGAPKGRVFPRADITPAGIVYSFGGQ